jgi:hypothetical protein
MLAYTAGIRKIIAPPIGYCGVREEFMDDARTLGFLLAAWNGDVYRITDEGFLLTGLSMHDFAFGTDD